jgi:hypothetical protein
LRRGLCKKMHGFLSVEAIRSMGGVPWRLRIGEGMCVFFFLSFSIHGSILTSLLHDTKNKITQFYDRTFMLDSPERTGIVENYQKDYGEEQQPFMYSVATSIPCSHLILPSCSYRYLSRAVH